jgi:hypothetical protein
MRAFALLEDGLQLGLADVTATLRPAVESLGFESVGDVSVRRFPDNAQYAETAAAHFELCAEEMVRQAAGLEPTPWESTLEAVLDRVDAADWWLAGSAALAVRGLAVQPRDLDLIASDDGCARLADVLSDLLVEPLADGAWLGRRWFRAFAGARIECVGGVHASFDDPEPCDFGLVASKRLEPVVWHGIEIRVPPLELQLRASERRGLGKRADLIREALK